MLYRSLSSLFDCRVKVKYFGGLLPVRLAFEKRNQVLLTDVFLQIVARKLKNMSDVRLLKIHLAPRQDDGAFKDW